MPSLIGPLRSQDIPPVWEGEAPAEPQPPTAERSFEVGSVTNRQKAGSRKDAKEPSDQRQFHARGSEFTVAFSRCKL